MIKNTIIDYRFGVKLRSEKGTTNKAKIKK